MESRKTVLMTYLQGCDAGEGKTWDERSAQLETHTNVYDGSGNLLCDSGN